MPNNFSFLWFFCNHDDVVPTIGVSTNMRTNFSFRWFVCTHVDDILNTLPYVFLPNSPLIASRMLNNFSFRCLEWNNAHEFLHEMDIIVVSQFGVFVFSHLEDVQMEFLHIDLAHALFFIYLCCANGVVNNNGHVVDDVLLYHVQKYLAWSFLCEGKSDLWMSSKAWFRPHTSTTQDLLVRAHRHFDKVTSFYLDPLPKPVELWLLFERCFALLVLLIGLMTSEGTFKSCFPLPPLHVHDELSSRTTLFQVGGDDAA
jgi:hypothetical protein